MTSLLELRVLEGPNLYFPRAAVKLTLDIGALAHASESTAQTFATGVGLRRANPGVADSGFRQRFAARAVARLVRAIASGAGTSRLAVRVRPSHDAQHVVVAFPWRHRGTALALGEAVAGVLDALAFSSPAEAIERAVQAVRSAEPGEPPRTIVPKIPIVAVTGTNGKTTTSRMIAHIARERGLVVGWSSTDGIYVDGELIEEGDYSGPSGAGRVLARPEVELAVTETARGGILLKGIGVTRNDVSVVTNVTADHLGLQGIDTLDQLAEVKSVVARITRKDGWAVLNADDPRVIAMAGQVRAQHWVFSREPEAPGVREALSGGGRATTVIDGWVCVLSPGRDPEPVIELAHVPMTLSGLSRFNVENALAATSAALAIGIDLETVRRGLATFHPDPEHNPGRMNLFSLRGVTVVLDLAHNEAGLQAMIEIMNGVRPPGARLLLALGAVGDRQDELLELLGELAARDCDEVVIAHKERYLRGRSRDDLEQLLRRGAERVGGVVGEVFDTEVEALASLVQRGQPGDVVGLMCHAERHEAYAWLSEQGASVDDPTTLTAKVRAANSRDLPPASPN